MMCGATLCTRCVTRTEHPARGKTCSMTWSTGVTVASTCSPGWKDWPSIVTGCAALQRRWRGA
eukprot:727067-Lingulodinium_polyedra.AAC.1